MFRIEYQFIAGFLVPIKYPIEKGHVDPDTELSFMNSEYKESPEYKAKRLKYEAIEADRKCFESGDEHLS